MRAAQADLLIDNPEQARETRARLDAFAKEQRTFLTKGERTRLTVLALEIGAGGRSEFDVSEEADITDGEAQ